MPGTGTPHPQEVQNYMENALDHYVAPHTGACADDEDPCSTVPVDYIAQFWPFPFEGWGGLEGAKWNVSVQNGVVGAHEAYAVADKSQHIVIFGYSQGATVSSIVKRQLADANGGKLPAGVTFVFIGNPNRPNGGLFERLALLGTVPILDATFGQPTPTDTADPGEQNTTDIALQYDGVVDFPEFPVNLLAVLNAAAGFWYVHGTYLAPDDDEPETEHPFGYDLDDLLTASNCEQSPANCQVHGDTTYITLPAKSLPIVQPFLDLADATGTGALIKPVVALLQPVLQTLIETGYDRTNYGKPSPFGLIPRVNPIQLVSDLLNDIPEGLQAAATTIETGSIPDLAPAWGSNAGDSDDSDSLVTTSGTLDTLVTTRSVAVDPPAAVPPARRHLESSKHPQLELPDLTLPKLESKKAQRAKLAAMTLADTEQTGTTGQPGEDTGDTEVRTRPAVRDLHPVRNFRQAMKNTLTAPAGIQRALQRITAQKPDLERTEAATAGPED